MGNYSKNKNPAETGSRGIRSGWCHGLRRRTRPKIRAANRLHDRSGLADQVVGMFLRDLRATRLPDFLP